MSLAISVTDLPPINVCSDKREIPIPDISPIHAPIGPPILAPMAVDAPVVAAIAPRSTPEPTIFLCMDFSEAKLNPTASKSSLYKYYSK